jgi:hypothetical protein
MSLKVSHNEKSNAKERAKMMMCSILSHRIARHAKRICSHMASCYRLTKFGNLPRQISTPKIPDDIEQFYQHELDWSITFMANQKSIGEEKLKKLIIDFSSPIPPIAAENIAMYAINIRKQNSTVGLPLIKIGILFRNIFGGILDITDDYEKLQCFMRLFLLEYIYSILLGARYMGPKYPHFIFGLLTK